MTSTGTASNATIPAPDRFSALRAVYDDATFAAIQSAKVLVVGAGGIGCELLKNLVLSGFMTITVLDLDTIDVSNLNRQFLFRRPHVGQSKALIARESVLKFQPTASITAIHGNIKDAQYDADWFGQFTLVMNALDNLDARRHVNRLCLHTPGEPRVLLESGTQGYAGQSTVIRGGQTECFECQPMPTPKTFAVCTIRNTPSAPVHCVVWAKALYAALFGPPDEENIMSDAKADTQSGVAEATQKQAAWLAGTADPASLASYTSFAVSVFRKLYTHEIAKQCEVKERWKDRTPPTPLELEALLKQLQGVSLDTSLNTYRARDQSVLTAAESAAYLMRAIDDTLATRTDALGDLTFDKDDALSMDFVACAANLRCTNFGIAVQSRFALKGIAGNIVHAIATTNAIAAGLMVADAIKILQGRPLTTACKTMWITRRAPGLLTSQELAPPNPHCFVCAQQTLELALDTERWTLKRLFDDVLRKKLSINEPSIDVVNRSNFIGTLDDHEEENPEYLQLPLAAPGVRVDHGALLSVDDQSQKLTVQLRIRHHTEWTEEDPDQFTISGAIAAPQPDADDAEETKEEAKAITAASVAAAAAAAAAKPAASTTDDDDIEMSDEPIAATVTASAGSKRKHDDAGTDASKKAKMADDCDVVELD